MKMPTLKDFLQWRTKLSDMDRMNFDTLLALPTARQIIERMQPGQYRNMAIYALALSEVIEGKSEHKIG